MRILTLVASVGVFAVAHAAAAQQASLTTGVGALPVFPGNPEATAQLATIVNGVRVQHLPVDPLIGKVNYAVLVAHAPATRVLMMARTVAARLPVARDALAPNSNDLDIVQAEEALSFNISKEIIAQIRAATSEPSIAAPLGTLTQLVASHVEVNRAADIVLSLVKRGATSKQLASLVDAVNSDVALGGRPDEALTIRMRFLTAALAPAATVQQGTGSQLTNGASVPTKPPKP